MCVARLLLIIFLLGVLPVSAQTYDEWIEVSFQCLDKDDLVGAEESLKRALNQEPANPRNILLLANLGTIQKRQGKLDDALQSYELALTRNPNNAMLLSNRANLYTEKGEYEKAIVDYTAILAFKEEDQDALYERGLLRLAMKDYLSAEADFEKIIEVNPNSLNGRKGYANLCKMKKEFDEAEKIYYFLIEKVTDDPGLYLGRAELYLLMKKNARAASDINKAIFLEEKTGKKDPYAYILRARLKMIQYEKESAIKDIELAMELGYDQKKGEELLKLCQ